MAQVKQKKHAHCFWHHHKTLSHAVGRGKISEQEDQLVSVHKIAKAIVKVRKTLGCSGQWATTQTKKQIMEQLFIS
jgi:hypothetical protein